MNILHSNFGRAVAGVSALSWLLVSPMAMGVAAADGNGDVAVTNTETVQVYTDATGKVDTKRVYEQLVFTGNGDVDIENPVSADGLRNLDGFSGIDVKDGSQTISTSVDGQKQMRSVSDFNGTLPLDVSVRYFLEGKEVQPGDVVGESGDLEVKYRVENVTGQMQQIEVDDGEGGTVTRNIEVVVPMVGSLTTLLPSTFTDVKSDQANMAGDGRGATKMSFTMTLFPPIGGPTADFGYTAKVTDGVIPRATISALPVNPLESPSFKGGAESYQGGSDTGAELTAGATEIDANLLKLRDGAADLSAGLMKLYDGAGQLSAGLNDKAVPGTRKLADGSTQLSDGADRLFMGSGDLVEGMVKLQNGTVQLSDGADRVSGGASKLSDGASRLNDGVRTVRNGASDLNDGAVKLRNGASDLNNGAARLDRGIRKLDSGAGDLSAGAKDLRDGLGMILGAVKSLPTDIQQDPDFQRLKGALLAVQAGIGSPTDTGSTTLLGGLNQLGYGLNNPNYNETNCDQDPSDGDPRDDCGASEANKIIAGKLNEGATKMQGGLIPAAQGAYSYIAATSGGTCPALGADGLPPAAALATPGSPCFAAAVSLLGYAAPIDTPIPLFAGGGLRVQSLQAAAALTNVYQGIDSKAIPGIDKVKKALYNANCNPAQTDPSADDFCGIAQAQALVSAGIDQLVQSISDQLAGVLSQAYTGSNKLYKGTVKLQSGTGRLAAGSQQLVDGSTLLADGTVVLADGTRRLADGTIVLADGTRRLADGTIKLSDGAQQLAAGAGDLNDGAGQLQDGGVRLHDGAGQLADGSTKIEGGLLSLLGGLVDAADGSNQLRSGLQTASDGAPQIEDGASKLSKKGTQKLIAAGSDTTVTFGEKYAQIKAGADRAKTESMALGAPQGAQGLTAYTYEIRGEDGEETRNWGRGIAALAVFGLGAGAIQLRRRFF